MRQMTGLALALLVFLGAGKARAQVDCTGGCTITKYGFGSSPDYRKDEVPPDQFRYTQDYFGPDFGGSSYFMSRTNFGNTRVGTCGIERGLTPLPGQVRLREQTGCVPTSDGPVCSAGTNAGAKCHLPSVNQGCTGPDQPSDCCVAAGRGDCTGFQNSSVNIHECGTGGVCTLDAGVGCRVEVVLSDGGITPTADTSEVRVFNLTYQAGAPNGQIYNLSAATGNTLGGTSFDGVSPATGSTCTVSNDTTQGNVRRRPTTGTRYLQPGGGGATYIRWDSNSGLDAAVYTDLATSFRFHTDDSAVCCGPNIPGLNTCSSAVPPFTPEYPLLTVRDCNQAGRFVNEDNVVPDWIFQAGQGTAFHTDRNFVLPGMIPGLCKVNRDTACYETNMNKHCVAAGRAFDRPLACCTGPGAGSCTANTFCAGAGTPFQCCTGVGAGTCDQNVCAGLDANPATPQIEPDTCDLSQPGPRVQVGPDGRNPFSTANQGSNPSLINDSRRDWCGNALYVIRGTPNQGCSLLPRFDYNGDPGPDCGVVNYGIDHRLDNDCNGVADHPDLCPRTSEWNQTLDSDGDCADPLKCRGDECECGDQTGSGVLSGTVPLGNGLVNVSDLVGINLAIFGSVIRLRLCDANNDTACNVSDIVAANKEIFTPDSSVCRHITPRQCLGGVTAPCCGNGILETSELCDDGDLVPDDGCNGACRVEFGWNCTQASPSVCTRL
jgi:cysteine-rich repeat protein